MVVVDVGSLGDCEEGYIEYQLEADLCVKLTIPVS